ncbi:MAG: sugar transferase [Clostridia bacterium]|nr:sugar transferase [Clostridia bacterium]
MEIKNSELTYDETIMNIIASAELERKAPIEKKKLIEAFVKRSIDILGSICGIIILAPLTFIIGIANLTQKDKGPIFYTQERIGKDGKLFKLYKFRSMIVGADEKLEKYLAQNEEARKEYTTYKKLRNDPRITKVGEFIRKTSLDEFPQFINVLKGEMSLVGPRPYLPREEKDMGLYYEYIIKDKPGLTGLWQISGRSEITFQDRLNIDLEYYRNNNFDLYIKVLVKTFLKIIKREGAR